MKLPFKKRIYPRNVMPELSCFATGALKNGEEGQKRDKSRVYSVKSHAKE